jgi:MoxR-like ATPase
VDRFMLKVKLTYPSKADELAILQRMAHVAPGLHVDPVLTAEELAGLRDAVERVYLDPKLAQYVVDVVHTTRQPEEQGLRLGPYIQYGASPRGTIALALAAKARAFLEGRAYVTPEDVKAIGPDVLRHRVIVSYEAEADEVPPEKVIQDIFDHVKVP